MLREAVEFHGHLCIGQVIGVRIAIAGLRQLGIQDPKDFYDLIVYVENNRCVADAIMIATYRRFGRRTLKFIDYGKMAATFVDTSRKKAIRVHPTELCRKLVKSYRNEIEGYSRMTDEQLLVVEEVDIIVPPQELPTAPVQKTACENCGEIVFDMKVEKVGENALCRACAFGAYYMKKNNH